LAYNLPTRDKGTLIPRHRHPEPKDKGAHCKHKHYPKPKQCPTRLSTQQQSQKTAGFLTLSSNTGTTEAKKEKFGCHSNGQSDSSSAAWRAPPGGTMAAAQPQQEAAQSRSTAFPTGF